MGQNWAVAQPHDKQNELLVGYPAAMPAKATYATISALGVSSVITLTDNTTVIEVEASGGNGVAIKWFGATDTNPSVISSGLGANFDHVVPAGQIRRFVVPQSVQGITSIVGLNKQAGLYPRVAVTAAGAAASVLLMEF